MNIPSDLAALRSGGLAYLGASLVCGVAAVLALALPEALDLASLMLVFILAVVISAAWFGRGPAMLSAAQSVLLFNVLFVPPRYSLAVAETGLVFMLAMMLLVGLIVGQLTASLRAQAQAARESAQRERSLHDIARQLGSALTTGMVDETARHFMHQQLGVTSTLWVTNPSLLRVSPGAASAELDALVGEVVRSDRSREPRDACFQGTQVRVVALRGTMAVRGALALGQPAGVGGWSDQQQGLVDTCAALLGAALERIHYIEVACETAVQMEGERLRNALLSTISHDLRTPLTSMVGLAESLALTQPGLSSQQQGIAQSMVNLARRVSSMVINLLDLARVESGPVRLKAEWMPVEELVGASLAATGRVLDHHIVQVHVPEDMPLVCLDAVLMERVMVNLLENAGKHTPAGSTVVIAARHARDHWSLCVQDNGPGLPAGRQQAMFRKFERGVREGSTPGFGLGLALCRAIVEAHGGSIEAVSPGGPGASFLMTFPATDPPPLTGQFPLGPGTQSR